MLQVADARSLQPQSSSSPVVKQQASVPAKPKVPPSLPPRLPPRSGNSTPSPTVAGGLDESQGYLNQGAVNRLGAAGISVPGFGIGVGGRTPPPSLPTPPPLAVSQARAPGHSQTTDGLQARFARMATPSSSHTTANSATETGTQPKSIGQVPSVLGKKKPPPPPPKSKKPVLSGAAENADTPPPIPLATRPRFN
ncbi:hypothetical protein NPX13_g11289 [Xylaria arbuscula]|uniref:Uncharacterized protein n=1 Tax=Xylaria arbuscula TaxID=114810 RepID=A0A9W8N361_9PEZI|nr:hypothetical protein NPX13_g11289 [Xylaria arbuscula]